jgi:hypothetical protein
MEAVRGTLGGRKNRYIRWRASRCSYLSGLAVRRSVAGWHDNLQSALVNSQFDIPREPQRDIRPKCFRRWQKDISDERGGTAAAQDVFQSRK